MCEWLSCREWCDVRLQCGTRAFTAHRAVLASVSAFLRRILLSCPTEDSPTFIVLPDFDLDTMPSVLYYIYNGEVVIQKQKLETFMEIVKALQIFVDEQYLPSACKSFDTPLCSSLYNQTYKSNKVFCLGDVSDAGYVNLKKGNHTECVLHKNSYSDSHLRDNQTSSEDWSENVHESTESAYAARQRGFLRDLFMETYPHPQNGNTNGRAAGVLSIQSALYRAPASLLLTHANGKHLRVDGTDLQKTDTTTPQWFSAPLPLKSQNHIQNINYDINNSNLIKYAELAQLKKFNSAFSYFNSKLILHPSSDNMMDPSPPNQSQKLPWAISELTGKSMLSLNSGEMYPGFSQKSFCTRNIIQDIDKDAVERNNKLSAQNVCSKAAVRNEVLDSPWRPRQPTNYRPFRRKFHDKAVVLENKINESIINDTNNNIQTSPTLEVIENITANASTMEPLRTITGLVVGSDLKCAVCDQVFTSHDALSSHIRRHSSPARYSCTECSKTFSQLRNFKYHMSVHRGTREFAATCSICGKYFNDRGYLSSHMKIHRNRKEYKCSQCPKSFNQRVAYNMHVRIHTGVKPHVCSECGKAFSRKMLLKQHQRTHSGERPYACTHCDKRFADRSNMTLHLRLHTGIKPFSCTLCPKSFTKKHHLKSHLNFHTGAKPYSCPKCKLAFTQSSNMRTHLKKCTAPDPTDKAESQNSIL